LESYKIVMFSDGTMYVQLTPGVQPSGSVNTSPDNSFSACAVAVEGKATYACTMGDDLVAGGPETSVELFEETYSNLNLRLKFCSESAPGEPFEFCSNLWESELHYPTEASVYKTRISFLSQAPRDQTEELVEQLRSEHRHIPDCEAFISAAVEAGWGKSVSQRLRIVNHCGSCKARPSESDSLIPRQSYSRSHKRWVSVILLASLLSLMFSSPHGHCFWPSRTHI
jgi:hypothetical protein